MYCQEKERIVVTWRAPECGTRGREPRWWSGRLRHDEWAEKDLWGENIRQPVCVDPGQRRSPFPVERYQKDVAA